MQKVYNYLLMKHEFMREFDGVPLQQTKAEKSAALTGLLRMNAALLERYAGFADSQDVRPRGMAYYVHLHDPETNEVVVFSGILRKEKLVHGSVTFTDTVEAPAPRELQRYTTESRGVVRSQEQDHDAATAFDVEAMLREARRRIAGQPKTQKPTVDMSRYALSSDVVSPGEITGMHEYLLQKSEAGLFVPVTENLAFALIGTPLGEV